MVRRGASMAPLLLVMTLAAACAGPTSDAEQVLPSVVPAVPESADTESLQAEDKVSDVTGETSLTAADGAVEEETFGLSARSTRGHVWAEPIIDGDLVAISLPVAMLGDHIHFEVADDGDPVGFIGYFTEGRFFVRASYCPDCGGQRVEWGGSLVVCRSCEARFDAVTGEGEDGARGYPDGMVTCTVSDGLITISLGDLVEAHARTLAGEATLFQLPEPVEDGDRGDRSWPRCCTT